MNTKQDKKRGSKKNPKRNSTHNQKRIQKQKLIVVTRSKPGSEEWMEYLCTRGFKPYHFPTIITSAADPSSGLTEALRDISCFDWVVFTSAAGPRFLKILLEKEAIASPKNMPNIAVVGDRTAQAVREAGYKVAFQSSKADGKTLAQELELVTSRRNGKHRSVCSILLLRTAIAAPELAAILRKRGAEVADVAIYQTKLITRPDPKFSALLTADRIGLLTFASPSSVEGFCARIPKKLIGRVQALPAIAVGPSVRAVLRKVGFKNIFMAKKPTIEGMIDSMADAIRAQDGVGL